MAAFNTTIDAPAERVLRRALAKAPGARFATIQEFGAARAGAAGLPSTSGRPPSAATTPPAGPAPSMPPPADDVRFSTTLQASTGQVRGRAAARSKTLVLTGVVGVAALGAVVVPGIWRRYVPVRGPATSAAAPAPTAAPAAPSSAPAAPPPAPHPDPLPAKPGEGNDNASAAAVVEHSPTLVGERAAVQASQPAARKRSGGKRGKRAASAASGAPAARPREVLIDDL
jgi:DNA polymerase-3 subunit gamma/tau